MVVWEIIQWKHRTPGKERWRLLLHPAMVDFYFWVAWYVAYLSLKIPQQNSNEIPSHRIPLEKKTSGMTGNDINHKYQNYSKMLSWNTVCRRYLVSAPMFLETYHLFICRIWNHLDVGVPRAVTTLISGDLSISFELNRNWQYFRNRKGSLLESCLNFLQEKLVPLCGPVPYNLPRDHVLSSFLLSILWTPAIPIISCAFWFFTKKMACI